VCSLFFFALPGCDAGLEPAIEVPTAIPAETFDTGVAAGKLPGPEAQAALEGLVARAGWQCADIVGVRFLGELTNDTEVVCFEQPGGSKRISYIIDLGTEQVRKND
jgi:hypothetical protein